MHQSATDPFAALIPDAAGDYTLTIDLTVNREDDRRGPDGHWAPDRRESFDGRYAVAAGREAGRWYLVVTPTDLDADGDVVNTGPAVVDLRDQTDGTDPLTHLRALLTGATA